MWVQLAMFSSVFGLNKPNFAFADSASAAISVWYAFHSCISVFRRTEACIVGHLGNRKAAGDDQCQCQKYPAQLIYEEAHFRAIGDLAKNIRFDVISGLAASGQKQSIRRTNRTPSNLNSNEL